MCENGARIGTVITAARPRQTREVQQQAMNAWREAVAGTTLPVIVECRDVTVITLVTRPTIWVCALPMMRRTAQSSA